MSQRGLSLSIFNKYSGFNNSSGRTLLETLLVIFFLFIVLLAAMDRLTSSIGAVKEGALRIELSNMRSGVNLYTMTKKRLPRSMNELILEKIVVSKQGIDGVEFKVEMVGKYVESMTVDENGVPIDPFGNAYTLDPGNGMVRSTTPGYENW